MTRRTVHVDGGLLCIEQRLRVRSRTVGTDVSGPAWIYASIRVTRGTVSYVGSSARVSAPGACIVVLPPFAIVQASLERCEVTTTAIAFGAPAHNRLPDLPPGPLLISCDHRHALPDPTDGLARLRATLGLAIPIGRAAAPRSLAARGKAIIDAEYAAPITIGGVARRLGTSPAVFSRAFHAAYGDPPVRYRHHLRVVDALMRLAGGAVPIDVFQDVGFEDLSRFYKVFRRVACAAPGTYRPTPSRNAKT